MENDKVTIPRSFRNPDVLARRKRMYQAPLIVTEINAGNRDSSFSNDAAARLRLRSRAL